MTAKVDVDLLRSVLRPPGCGSSSPTRLNPLALPLLEMLYATADPEAVAEEWLADLQRLVAAEVILLGIPSDTGAGFRRGAAFGPIGVRLAHYSTTPRESAVVDAGDVLAIPHLLHDDMLAPDLLASIRASVFNDPQSPMPVSPLSVAEYACRALRVLAPDATLISIGGDHSVSAPCIASLPVRADASVALLHFDAHSDLSTERFGVPLTYGSWIHHVWDKSPLIAVVQCGIEQVEYPAWIGDRLMVVGREEAERTDARSTGTLIEAWLREREIEQLYVTIDVDVTVAAEAPATGTPAPVGLPSRQILEIVNLIGETFRIVGADVVEVAPPLGRSNRWEDEPTCRTGAQYLRTLIDLSRSGQTVG